MNLLNLNEIKPSKILIINIFGIGDVLFTTPLISNLKAQFPNLYIGYLCNKRALGVLKNNPNINKFFIYERDEFAAIYKKSKLEFLKEFGGLIGTIKNEKFDLVIDLSLGGFTSFLAWLAGIKRRVGFNYKKRSPFLNYPIKLDGFEGKHVAEYYLEILEKLGVTVKKKNFELYLDKEDNDWAEQFIISNKINPKKKIIGVCPGGGASWGSDAKYKQLPQETYIKLLDKLIEISFSEVILMGDLKDAQLCEEIAKKMKNPSHLACNKASLMQSAALIKKCDFVIVNDGGLLHIASAFGVKTVSIFGPVDDKVYGPFPKDGHIVVTADVACRPCYRQFRRAKCEHISCLKEISAERIIRVCS